MNTAVVKESGEGGGGGARHAALLEKLNAHVATGRVNTVNEVRHAGVEERVSEVSIFFSEGTDTGGFKPGNLQMLYVTWWATYPLEAVFDAGKPVVEHGFETSIVTGEGSRAPTVGWHE